MSKELKELHTAVANYALDHSIAEIPKNYYEKMASTWLDLNMKGHDLDKYQAAAALLYAAVVDGMVHRSQMTPQGYRAIKWAERYLRKLDSMPAHYN